MSGRPPFLLPDLCDAHAAVIRVVDPVFRHFGGRTVFAGAIRTIRCFEDNSRVAERVREPGNGAVLVVDGGGSLRCALVGDNLAGLARDHGWSGIVVHGCVRDVDELAAIDVGVMALASHPLRSEKRGEGQRDVPVGFGGVRFEPGHWLYADRNGLAVAPVDLLNPNGS
jgi:regulator of ribonuclease activity A